MVLVQMTNSSIKIVQQINEFLAQGNIAEAIKLDNDFWRQGEEMSNTDMIAYVDTLLNMGELKRAKIILQKAIDNPREHIDFCDVMIKYNILAPDLVRLKQLGEYTDIYQQNPEIFDWAVKAVEQRTVLEYSLLLKTAQKHLLNKMMLFEYEINDEILNANFYTNENEDENNLTTKKITDEINAQFAKRGLEIPDKMKLNIFCLENS